MTEAENKELESLVKLLMYCKTTDPKDFEVKKGKIKSFVDRQVNKALEEVEKSLPSDKEIGDECIDGKVCSYVEWYRNKTQEAINNIKKG